VAGFKAPDDRHGTESAVEDPNGSQRIFGDLSVFGNPIASLPVNTHLMMNAEITI
jgi:hypothetical protein